MMPPSHALALAADHGGFFLKEEIVKWLGVDPDMRDLRVSDLGVSSPEAVDYADFAHTAATGIARGLYTRAILVCGTGVGMAIAANRHSGVRAVNCTDTYTARLSREHNDSNVLALGGRVLGTGLALDIVRTWLTTPFAGDARHTRRIGKIELPRGERLPSP